MVLTAFLVFNHSSEQKNYALNHALTSSHALETWQHANLQEVFAKPQTYSFDKDALQHMLANPNLNEFRFLLGVENNTLQVTCVGLDANKQQLLEFTEGTVQNNTLEIPQNTEAFNKPNDINELANKHLLDNKQAIKDDKRLCLD